MRALRMLIHHRLKLFLEGQPEKPQIHLNYGVNFHKRIFCHLMLTMKQMSSLHQVQKLETWLMRTTTNE